MSNEYLRGRRFPWRRWNRRKHVMDTIRKHMPDPVHELREDLMPEGLELPRVLHDPASIEHLTDPADTRASHLIRPTLTRVDVGAFEMLCVLSVLGREVEAQ